MRQKNQNIAHIVYSLNLGGLERVVIDLAINSKFKTYVFTLEKPGILSDELKKKHIIVKSIQKRGGKSILTIFKLFFLVKKYHIKVLHAHNYAPLVYSNLVKFLNLNRVSVIYTEHNQLYSLPNSHYAKYKFHLSYADYIITVSKLLYNEIQKQFDIKTNIEVIHNGIDDLLKLNKKLDVCQDKNNKGIVIGTIANLTPQKALNYFVDIAYMLVQKSLNVNFIIIGDGKERKILEELIEQKKIKTRVELLGFRMDAREIISKFDIFLLTSLWEGLPIAVLEAQALGIPCVLSNVGGIGEIVTHEFNGLLFPKGDVTQAASEIKTLIDNKDLYKKISKKSRQNFLDNFTIEKMVLNYENIYSKFLNERDDY